ncbi:MULTISPECIES: hypothetical protein [Clostridia]|jgi:hypothetical protein|uniref:hypothetical protein n=1 Tax=Clostridia TaxID=186801 RepID=UPI00210BCFE8|nr:MULTISPECIES: hypothetical protein [Clostridia]MCQ5308955.1 hypothetical protein [Flavonifractor plautii]MEE0650366.1 hypothetical protein [[Clostridium] scindens]
MANEKECPFKKGSPDDFLLFRNVNPPSTQELMRMREIGAVALHDAGGGKASIEIIGSKCTKEQCALWYEDAQECSILSLAKTTRRIVRNGR